MSKEITPKYPVKTGSGATVEVVTMRRAKVKDLRQMERFGKTDAEQELGLIAHLAGLVPEDLEEIDAVDYRAIQDSFRELLGVAKG